MKTVLNFLALLLGLPVLGQVEITSPVGGEIYYAQQFSLDEYRYDIIPVRWNILGGTVISNVFVGVRDSRDVYGRNIYHSSQLGGYVGGSTGSHDFSLTHENTAYFNSGPMVVWITYTVNGEQKVSVSYPFILRTMGIEVVINQPTHLSTVVKGGPYTIQWEMVFPEPAVSFNVVLTTPSGGFVELLHGSATNSFVWTPSTDLPDGRYSMHVVGSDYNASSPHVFFRHGYALALFSLVSEPSVEPRITVADGGTNIFVTVIGQSNRLYHIESSGDLKSWGRITSSTNPAFPGYPFARPKGKMEFYRALLAP